MRLELGPLSYLGAAIPIVIALIAVGRSIYLVPLLMIMGFLAGMAFFVHLMAGRHFALIPIALVVIAWLRGPSGAGLHPALSAWIGALAVCGVVAAFFALRVPFTESRAMAAWIGDNKLAKESFVSFPDYLFQLEIAAFHGQAVTGLSSGCAERFARWNYDQFRFPGREHARRVLQDVAARSGGVAYLVTEPTSEKFFLPPADFGLTPIMRFEKGMMFRRIIYRVEAPALAQRSGPRRCNTAR
jgi:hypothetical protein